MDRARKLAALIVVILGMVTSARAQEPATREAAIEQEQSDKVQDLHPYVPGKVEQFMNRADQVLTTGLRWHPFFQNAYSGGGFTLGVGYAYHLSSYNVWDFRGSYTIKGYKRFETEFIAPRLFKRRGKLSVLAGWREATEVGFYGLGTNTSLDDATNYNFQQPYGSALLTVFPTRRMLMLRGGVELSQWKQGPGQGSSPSVEEVYTPETLPGLGAKVTYVHTQGTLGIDWRPSAAYARRGGFYGITANDFNDLDGHFGFERLDYEVIQHFPILREAWVISLRGMVQTAFNKDGQQVPFFMLPSAGGGSTLRGYSSWRFRDQNSMLVQAEWRIMVNRFLDTAFFYDAGKVTSRRSDINFDDLKSDFGFGVRFHGPLSTPLRVELAKSPEGLSVVFSSSAAF